MRKKMCAHVGCNAAVPLGRRVCPKHETADRQYQSARQAHYDKTVRLVRDADLHEFYLSSAWNATVPAVRDKFKGLCVWSYFIDGVIVEGDEVHHIKPIRTDWALRLDISNLILLSHSVHMKIEAAYRLNEKAKIQAQKQLLELLERWKKEFACPQG